MSKTTPTFDRYRKNRPIDILNTIYLVFITSIYAVFMHNKYFDITATRAATFEYSGFFYALLMIMAVGLELFMIKYYEPETSMLQEIFRKDTKLIALPEFWMFLFLTANFFAFLIAPDKAAAWPGSTGRYYGLCMILVMFLVFVSLARDTEVSIWVFVSLALTAGFTFFMAYMHHFGGDPFGLKRKIVDRQKELFISTFGNINTYGTYLAMVIPLFAGLFIFSKKLWVRVVSGVMIFAAGMAIIPAKSDNVYLGAGVAFIVLLYLAINYKQLTEYIFSVLLLISGLLFMAILNKAMKGSQKHINGIAKIVENPKLMGLFFVLVLIILVAAMIFRKLNYVVYKDIQNKWMLIILSIVLGLGMILAIVIGKKNGSELLTFNDDWGTYRGYIWSRLWRIYCDAGPLNKLFGHGTESIARLMNERFFEEMVSITGKKYDNAHNEYLQYLITTGIYGVVTFVGLAVSVFCYVGKRLKGDPVAIACIAAAAGYLAQTTVSLNQPITSPNYIVLIGVAVGCIRHRDLKEKYENGER